jgi:hypothetical protein
LAAACGCREERPARGHSPLERMARTTASKSSDGLPRLLALGADACIPCRKMVPVLDELDTVGKELYRHNGFIAKEDIVKKWQELGVTLAGTGMEQ